jgi:broad specificity phosphatase PhoE
MGRILLIRHAQASFLEQNYDKLSTIGETQARRLGQRWARQKMLFHGVCSGPGVRCISKNGRGQQLAVFCSAGLIGVAMRRALHLSLHDTLRATWMIRNGSFSEFLFSGDRFTLSTFNSFPHLDEVSLLTYR